MRSLVRASSVARRATRSPLVLSLSTKAAKSEETVIVSNAKFSANSSNLKADSADASGESYADRTKEMAAASKAKKASGTAWQRFVGGVVDTIRPVCAALHPTVQPLLDRAAMQRVEDACNIEDLRLAAQKRAHAMVFGYLDGGADGEVALRRSVEAYQDIELRHAVLHGVPHGGVDLRTEVLGIPSELPFFITSCAGQRMFHADGEIATARAAAKHGAAMALSQLTTSTFEDVGREAPDHCKALQLYVWRDRALLQEVPTSATPALRRVVLRKIDRLASRRRSSRIVIPSFGSLARAV